jgi:predicted nuclease with TOPRIM domain
VYSATEGKDIDKLRADTVRILSHALNNTIQEFGYFPGIGHALVEVRAEAAKLREQNAKLTNDNTTLSHIVNQQREHIKKLTEHPVTDESILRGLQHQVQQLKIDRDSLFRTQQQ